MGCNTRSFKALFGAFASLVFIFLLLVGVAALGVTETKATIAPRSTGNFKQVKLVGKENLVADHSGLDINYMSKRRVPNGPDPIHNRRAGNSKQPPGQA